MSATSKKTKRNKRKTKKMRGGKSPSFTLMTFNVELFGYLPTYPEKNLIEGNENIKTPDFSKYEEATIDEMKLLDFKTLFSRVDIACLQESVIKSHDYIYEPLGEINNFVGTTSIKTAPNYDGQIGKLQQVVSCKSHNLTWPRSVTFYGEGSKIANSIYVKPAFLRRRPFKSNYFLTRNYEVADVTSIPRCFAMAELTMGGKKVKVATVHLIGGRFEDEHYFLGTQEQRDMLIEEKKHQLKTVIDVAPDVICGDFNTKLKPFRTSGDRSMSSAHPNITAELMKYAKSFYRTVSSPDDEELMSLVEKWLFMDEYDAILNDAGYDSVYTEYPREETSAYGGVVDFIYYKRDRLEVVDGSVAILDGVLGTYVPTIDADPRVDRSSLNGLKYVNGFSDHAPVKATFRIK